MTNGLLIAMSRCRSLEDFAREQVDAFWRQELRVARRRRRRWVRTYPTRPRPMLRAFFSLDLQRPK